jgi:hypothetical protein
VLHPTWPIAQLQKTFEQPTAREQHCAAEAPPARCAAIPAARPYAGAPQSLRRTSGSPRRPLRPYLPH